MRRAITYRAHVRKVILALEQARLLQFLELWVVHVHQFRKDHDENQWQHHEENGWVEEQVHGTQLLAWLGGRLKKVSLVPSSVHLPSSYQFSQESDKFL